MMEVTESGMETDANEVQLENAKIPIEVTVSGILIDFSTRQQENI